MVFSVMAIARLVMNWVVWFQCFTTFIFVTDDADKLTQRVFPLPSLLSQVLHLRVPARVEHHSRAKERD
jgi:hypothetical protein